MIGDATDIEARLRRYLPPWFGPAGGSPAVDAVLAGVAAVLSNIYGLIAFTRQQARIATSTGGWLDLTAYSFLGNTLPRFHLEEDDGYRERVRREIFRDRNTRQAGIDLVTELTGAAPFVYEGWYGPVCGGLGSPSFSLGGSGRIASRGAPCQVIFEVPLPQTYGIPNRGGLGDSVGGLGAGNFSLVDDSLSGGHGASITDILNRLNSIRTDGVEYWVRFTQPAGF